MKVFIGDILKSDGASLDLDFSEVLSDLNAKLNGYVFDNPVSFKGTIVNTSGVLKLNGHLKTGYTVKCYRCLSDIHKDIELDIEEDVLNAEKNSETEAYTYQGNSFMLDKVLEDNIVLNLPMRQLCREECKGLCAVCGNDLNEKECGCETEDINPRMQALKNFFKDNEQ